MNSTLLIRPAAGEAQERQDRAEEDEHAALIAQRGGAVLGPYTILKEDHFRGEPGRSRTERGLSSDTDRVPGA